MAIPAERKETVEAPRSVKELTRLLKEKVRDLEDGNRTWIRETGTLAEELKPQIAGGKKGWDAYCREQIGFIGVTVDRWIGLAQEERRLQQRFAKQAHAGPAFKARPNYSKIWGAMKDDVRVKAEERRHAAQMDDAALQKKLGHRLIDLGFKALAVQIHPDTGGKADGKMMDALMAVRERLRRCLDRG